MIQYSQISDFLYQYGISLNETYFEMIRGLEKGIPTGQTLVDMDKDGIKELILSYDRFFIFLCFKNDKVYGSDVKLDSMNTIYTDGSFSWSNQFYRHRNPV